MHKDCKEIIKRYCAAYAAVYGELRTVIYQDGRFHVYSSQGRPVFNRTANCMIEEAARLDADFAMAEKQTSEDVK